MDNNEDKYSEENIKKLVEEAKIRLGVTDSEFVTLMKHGFIPGNEEANRKVGWKKVGGSYVLGEPENNLPDKI